jgi:hypothetical protein
VSRGGNSRPIASDLLEAGWLTPNAAAAKLDITVQRLNALVHDGKVRRKSIGPGMWLYDVRGMGPR